MTGSNDWTDAVCPICGTTLVDQGETLYCPVCDLVYEADDHPDHHRSDATGDPGEREEKPGEDS